MNLKLQSRNIDVSESLQKLIERQSRKIRKMLPTFPSEVTDLTITVEKLPRGSQYQTSLVLTVPQRAIRVEEIEDNPTSSIIRAFSELLRRVKKFKSQLNRERLWRRQPSQTAAEASSDSVRELENAIGEYLEKIENYVRRELYFQVVMNRLSPGQIEPQALVDEVFLDLSSNASARPTNLSLEQWMIQVARHKLQGRLRELSQHSDEPHVEESANAEPRWEDEDLNFYQPDESLRLEDLMVDQNIETPEEALQREEAELQLQKAVARLPENVRESFVLFAVEGFTSDEVAMITGREPEQVLQEVEKARQELRQEIQS